MNHRSLMIVPVLFLLFGWAVGAGAQEKLWVSSTGAKLKEDRQALSKTVAAVEKGSELNVLEREGKWYRVTAPDGSEGWIYRGKVSEEAPAAGSNPDGGLFGALTASSIEAGASDTSRSIRGLSEETETYANAAGSPREAREALDRVLETRVANKDLEQFLREGRIGEYAP